MTGFNIFEIQCVIFDSKHICNILEFFVILQQDITYILIYEWLRRSDGLH